MSGRNFAIAIGINNYQNLQPLQYARRDAEAMLRYFLGEVGFEKVYYFSEKSPPIQQDYGAPIESRPTYGTLRRFLRMRFERPFLGAGDNFWFFFAGHGIRKNNRDYLMPIDGDPGDVENTAISLHYIRERLLRSGADNVVLLLDACRSEGRRAGLGVAGSRYPGIVTFYSCSPEESSYEIEELLQGAFTHVLLQGLRIQGEGNCATVERLSRYLRNNVPALVEQYKKRVQTPVVAVEPASKYHLILLPKLATVADTNVLRVDAFAAEQKSDYRGAKELWTRILVYAPGDSQAIEAIERLAVFHSRFRVFRRDKSRSDRSGIQLRLTRRQWFALVELAGVGVISSFIIKAISELSNFRKTIDEIILRNSRDLQQFTFETVTVNAQGEEIEHKTGKTKLFTENLGNRVKLEMIAIPEGTFMMGAPETEDSWDNEHPQHLVAIQPFFIGQTPITQIQWRQVASFPKIQRDLNPDPSHFKGDDRPVERISWYDAIEFCARLSNYTGQSYRLPSEAEWEYACRARTITPFYFGETITTDLVNYNGNHTYASAPRGFGHIETTPVKTFPPSSFGLYDMHGNVWEWCADPRHGDYFNAPQNGRVWDKDEHDNSYQNLSENLAKFLKDKRWRIFRGGSWNLPPKNSRSASRSAKIPKSLDDNLGFRVALFAARLEADSQSQTIEIPQCDPMIDICPGER